MQLAIVTRQGDRFAKALAACVEALGGRVLILDHALDGNDTFAIDGSGVYWRDVAISTFDFVLVRGQHYQYPVVPRVDDEVDFSLWQTDYLAQQQRYSALSSALCELERRGVCVFNPLPALQADFVKPASLAALSAAGFATPDWLLSNDPRQVETFIARQGAQHKKIRWRPANGRGAWQRFERRQYDDLVAASKPPILLAGGTGDELLRCYVYRGRELLSLKVEGPTFVGLERLEQFSPVSCPLSATELERICTRIGANWLQLTFIGSLEGFRLYDFDTDPRPEELPAQWFDHLTQNLGRALSAKPITLLTSGQAIERKPLFLRRMLQMLFEMEASKYE